MKYTTVPEIIVSGNALGQIKASVDEIKLDIFRNKQIQQYKITKSKDAADFLREVYSSDPRNLPTYEMFWIIFVNCNNNVLGVYNLASGGVTGVIADATMAFAVALKILATSMIISHNHPSQNTFPSEADKKITEKFRKMGDVHGIRVLDHIILSNDDHYSFADNGESSLQGITQTITIENHKTHQNMITKSNIREQAATIDPES